MLSFKGAIGFITGANRSGNTDSDSGVSSASQESDGENEGIKD